MAALAAVATGGVILAGCFVPSIPPRGEPPSIPTTSSSSTTTTLLACDAEPNDTPTTATVAAFGQQVEACNNGSGDLGVDYFNVGTAPAGTLQIVVDCTPVGSAGAIVGLSTLSGGVATPVGSPGACVAGSVTVAATPGATYLLGVVSTTPTADSLLTVNALA